MSSIKFRHIAALTLLMMNVQAAELPNEGPADTGTLVYQELPAKAEVDQELGAKVAVFFQFTCPHCATFNPPAMRWGESLPRGITIEFVPAVVSKADIPAAWAYYAIKALDEAKAKQFIQLLQQRALQDRWDISSVPALLSVAVDVGVSERDFKRSWGNPAIRDQVTRAARWVDQYRVQAVPFVVVGNKYTTSPALVEDQNMFFMVLNGLVSSILAGKEAT